MGNLWRKPLACGVALACLIAALPRPLHAGKFNRVLSVGDVAPSWQGLAGTDGRRHALAELAEARLVVLIFTSHRCPVARAYDQRLVELQAELAEAGVEFVAIECGGSAEAAGTKMRQRAEQAGYRFTYVHDADLTVCRAYGATCTPTVFLLVPERAGETGETRFTVAYQGAIDDSADAHRVRRPYLRQAIDAVLAGREPQLRETRPTGCTIPGSQDENADQSQSEESSGHAP